MPTDPRAAVADAARALLDALAAAGPVRVRVEEVRGGVACLIQVWGVDDPAPTARQRKRVRRASGAERAGCRAAILAAIRAAGRPVTRKAVVRVLRDAGGGHGAGTVAKALAELTASGELVNPRDRKGYRLAAWRPAGTPGLFD